MKSIAIYSTNNLMPGNRKWKNLSEKYNCVFADYATWSSDFIEGENCQLIQEADYILFNLVLSDVFDNTQAQEVNEQALNVAFMPLESLLASTNKHILVAYSSYEFNIENVVSYAKQSSSRFRAVFQFENWLIQKVQDNKNLYLLNLDNQFSQIGISNCFDSRLYYSGRCRFSSQGLSVFAHSLLNLLQGFEQARKKLLILDCDNTLWGGVLGEEGIEKILIGQDGVGKAFEDFQKQIKHLKSQGILLAIASKNNYEDVMQVFDSHPQMILKKDDFVIFKINWSDKAENIKEIAEELSLGLSSFVFWDDNPIEREQMRVALPEVMVIDCPEEVAEWPNYLQKLTEFSQFQLTAEDLKKSEQYHIRAKFSNEIRTVANKKDYLKSIEMEPKVLSLTEETLDRAVQLCAKTNQFNLRTMRHSRDDLLKLNELGPIGLGSLKDKFGDHGIVGMYVATIQDRRTAFLDTFLLSCRVIGRYFESWLLNQCILSLKNKGVEFLYAEFIDSGKNKVSQNFLNDHHFVNAENGRVVLELNNYKFEQLEVF